MKKVILFIALLFIVSTPMSAKDPYLPDSHGIAWQNGRYQVTMRSGEGSPIVIMLDTKTGRSWVFINEWRPIKFSSVPFHEKNPFEDIK
jgi:hypothetical protein